MTVREVLEKAANSALGADDEELSEKIYILIDAFEDVCTEYGVPILDSDFDTN